MHYLTNEKGFASQSACRRLLHSCAKQGYLPYRLCSEQGCLHGKLLDFLCGTRRLFQVVQALQTIGLLSRLRYEYSGMPGQRPRQAITVV